MENKQIVILVVAAILLSSLFASSITGYASYVKLNKIIRSHSCDADDICEVNGEIKSNGSLTLIPSTGNAKIEADLTLTSPGFVGGVYFKSNEEGSLTITPGSGHAKIEGDLRVTDLQGTGNAYVCVEQGGLLYRSSTPCI